METHQTQLINSMTPELFAIYTEAMKQQTIAGALKVYLNQVCKTDPQLDEGMKNPGKTIGGCEHYITQKAKNHLGNRHGAVCATTIFGWAIHYFTESEEVLASEVKEAPASKKKKQDSSQEEVAERPKQEAKPAKKPVAKKKVESNQLDLFSFMDSPDEQKATEHEVEEEVDCEDDSCGF